MLIVVALASMASPSHAADDFSAQLDALWNYDQPADSEARFRAEAARHGAGSREALEAATQVARAQGLQRRFVDADATLDAVARLLPALEPAPALARVRTRYLLERGRVRNSAGDPAAAVPRFKEALVVARDDTLPGADYYRVDALHMLGIAAPKGGQIAWNLKAAATAQASSDPRARGWAASLENNIGWTYFEAGDANEALAHWQRALALREAAGKAGPIRIARWTVARGYRALSRLDDAQRVQLALVAETEKAGEPDGYVYEELAEIEAARGNAKAAAAWAAKAHALLQPDADFVATEPARLARLAALAQEAR
ncbi:MAG: hypothetical protein U1F48_09785 [Burkholderiales bacterium]